jgi:hypothetical protein
MFGYPQTYHDNQISILKTNQAKKNKIYTHANKKNHTHTWKNLKAGRGCFEIPGIDIKIVLISSRKMIFDV